MFPDWPKGYGRIVLEQTDSTNAEAARLSGKLTEPTWILALHQTAARGRRGRPWAMPAGNFAATLLMRPTEAPGQVALRSFVAALALFDAFVAVTGRAGMFALKWPNDVLLQGGKVAGILLESTGRAGGVGHLAIGIGVNLAVAPDAGAVEPGAIRPVALTEAGAQVAPQDFLTALADAFAGWEATFTAEGFGPVREAWLARAARLGEPLVARTGAEVLSGRFETVDAQGALILQTPQGRRAIPAADVYFG